MFFIITAINTKQETDIQSYMSWQKFFSFKYLRKIYSVASPPGGDEVLISEYRGVCACMSFQQIFI